MMNFFEHQDRARRNTSVLIFLMALGIVAMGLAIYALLMIVVLFHDPADLARSTQGLSLFQPALLFGTVAGTGVIVAGASGARALSLRGGGASIAEMLGGRLISGNAQGTLEKRLVNVVEEMAIASGVPVPQVFVLDQEPGINAFAAGFTLDDAAIGVTRGCLEALTREELQGVIAHEFSHILNGDMRLNIRLMGIVFGIVCIGLLGRMMLRSASTGSYSSRRDKNSGKATLLAFGLGVMLIGSLGELFGKLIKAAVSRQREFLADASAVQFTRNPGGIAGALKKIGGLSTGASLRSARADEASHFFFGDIHRRLFAFSMFATHPPLTERVQRLDPSFHGEFPAVQSGIIAQPEDPPGLVSRAEGPRPALANDPSALVARIGTHTPDTLAQGARLLSELPPELRDAARHPFSACAIVYALLLSDDAQVRSEQRARISALSAPALDHETARLARAVNALPRRDRLPLIELLSPALRELSDDQRHAFTRTVQALIEADRRISLFEYVLSSSLQRRLLPGHSAHARSHVRYRSLRGVHAELELLLSLLAHAGVSHEASAEQVFQAASARVPSVRLSLLPASSHMVSGLSQALDALAGLAPSLREQVVDACAHAVLADRRASDDELTLLGAVCDALGCPLPPLPES